MIGSTLNRRLAKLESLAAIRQVEPVYREEDRARMQQMIDRWYADPERYAWYITKSPKSQFTC